MSFIFATLPLFLLEWFGYLPNQDWKPMPPDYKQCAYKLDSLKTIKNQYCVGFLSGMEGVFFTENEKILKLKAFNRKLYVDEEPFGQASLFLKGYGQNYDIKVFDAKSIKSIHDLDFSFDNVQEKEFFILTGKVKSAQIVCPGKIDDDKEHNWQEHISAGEQGQILAQKVLIYCFKIRYLNELRYFYFLKLKHGKLGGYLLDFKPGKNMKIMKPIVN